MIKIFFSHPTFSDENFYFNVAKQILEGKTPYKDFFFAHPPLQMYLLVLLFKLFGNSLLIGKLFTLIFSMGSLLLIFLVAKILYDEKTGIIVSIFFMVTPAFLSFSSIGYGMFETLFFVLLSFYLFLKEKYFPSSTSMVIAVMFRYSAIFYLLPFIVFWKRKNLKKLFMFLTLLIILNFTAMFSIFGMTYFEDTIIYHTSLKIGSPQPLSQQYWSFSIPIIFLVCLSLFFSFKQKNKILLYLGLTILAVDLLLLTLLRNIFYHYFLISLPFYMLIIARTFQTKDKIIKIAIIGIFLLAIFNNFKTIDYYNNPLYGKTFQKTADYVTNHLKNEEKIFGEPSLVNYISFTNSVPIAGNYFDSFMTHVLYDGEEKVVQMLSNEKPKLIIEMKLEGNYYYLESSALKSFIRTNYKNIYNSSGVPEFLIFKLK